jgi:hypothetical protein
MEYDVSEMDSWNSQPGPFILCNNATRIEDIQDTICSVKAKFKEGTPMKVRTLLCDIASDIASKICQGHRPAITHQAFLSCNDSLSAVPDDRTKTDVRMFASCTTHVDNANEIARGQLLHALMPYRSREEMSESHRPPSRKRAWREQHENEKGDVEDSEERELLF